VSDVGIGSWVERRARFAPDDQALRHGSTTRTYAELAERIRRLANGFRARGVSRGDRVAWLGPNHPAYLETLFAAAALGAVTSWTVELNAMCPTLAHALRRGRGRTLGRHGADTRTPPDARRADASAPALR